MKRAYVIPPALESAVAVRRISDREHEVQFDFSRPEWRFLSLHLASPAHPAWFSVISFVSIFRGLGAQGAATALQECRWSCSRRIVHQPPVECSRVLVTASQGPEPQWIECGMSVADARGSVWAKCAMRAKLLGSAADFEQRRTAAKARAEPRTDRSREQQLISTQLVRGVTTVPQIGPLVDGRSAFAVSRRAAMEDHPYYSGSGDHVNTQMLSDLLLQFGAAVCREVLGVEADSFLTVASSMHMLRFVEFDVEMLLELTGTAAATVSAKSFSDAAPFEVACEWSDAGGELRVVRAQLTQQGRVCGQYESVLLPVSMSKL